MMTKVKRTKSSGNVFRDLGFGPKASENLLIRAQLMTEIEKYIQKEKITQAEAAKRLGVTQPRISDLIRGKLHLFSVDILIAMITHAGLIVDVRVRKPKAA
jgi:predicted XRE-type DNA-binding protein